MDASIWRTITDSKAMLRALVPYEKEGRAGVDPSLKPASARKLRLFAAACARLGWENLRDSRSRAGVLILEQEADGLTTSQEYEEATALALLAAEELWARRSTPDDADRCSHSYTLGVHALLSKSPWQAAQYANDNLGKSEDRASLLRDIFGNPYAPVVLPTATMSVPAGPWQVENYTVDRSLVEYCPWLTPTVREMALAAYEARNEKCPHCSRGLVATYGPSTVTHHCGKPTQRRHYPTYGEGGAQGAWCYVCWAGFLPEHTGYANCSHCEGEGKYPSPRGHLERESLLVLADALEEAGGNGEILDHLRGPGHHVKGCWAIDLLTQRR